MTPAPRDIAATVNPGGQRPPAPRLTRWRSRARRGSWLARGIVITAAALTLLVAAAQFRQSASATTQATLSPAVGTCPAWGAATSPTGRLRADAHPVVLVHGWTGKPLHGTLTGLANRLTSGWQFLLFDYSAEATRWASQPQIAKCLAEYLRTVSKAHHDAGGDSRVYVVAHSMGGLATLFAADGRFGDPAVASVMGGLVTLDTPFAGSAWGMTPLAAMLSEANRLASGSNRAFIDPFANGWVCLAKGSSCPQPNLLPRSVPVTQVAGQVTVARSIFGLHAYDIVLDSDTIVSVPSQHAYRGLGSTATVGWAINQRTVKCTTDIAALQLGPPGYRALAMLTLDNVTIDALGRDSAEPLVWEFTARAGLFASCSHKNIVENSDALDAVAAALLAQAARAPTTQQSPASSARVSSGGTGAAGGSVPAAFLGRWQGLIYQAGSKKSPYTFDLRVSQGKPGQTIGSGTYPSLKCGVTWRLKSASPRRVVVFEDVDHGWCEDVEVTLVLRSDGRLDYSFRGDIGRGVISRTAR